MVPICAQTAPECMALRAFRSNMTSLTASPVGNMVSTTLARAAACSVMAWAVAPRSVRRAAGPGVRFHTSTGNP